MSGMCIPCSDCAVLNDGGMGLHKHVPSGMMQAMGNMHEAA